MKLRLIAMLLSGFGIVACTESTPFRAESIEVPASQSASSPRLAGNDRNGIVLSWTEPGDGGSSLHYSRFENGSWSDARIVIRNRELFVNWADMPMVKPLGTGHLVAHWLEKSGGPTYAYDVVISQSVDGGRTWSEALRPHDDGTQTEHGFVSMFGHGDRTGLIWLDGRKTAKSPGDDPIDTSMTLRGAFVDRDNTIGDEQLIDNIVCDCCQTDVAIAASGPVVAYRDRTADEIRDISVSRFIDGRWQSPTSVANDNWEFPACPVNGPAIVADRDFVAVTWFTAAGDRPVVKLATSPDSGARFGAPIEVAADSVLGQVGLALLDDDHLAVSWLRKTDAGSHEVVVQKFDARGAIGPARVLTGSPSGRTVPQIARSGEHLILVWSQTDDADRRIVSTRFPVSAL